MRLQCAFFQFIYRNHNFSEEFLQLEFVYKQNI